MRRPIRFFGGDPVIAGKLSESAPSQLNAFNGLELSVETARDCRSICATDIEANLRKKTSANAASAVVEP